MCVLFLLALSFHHGRMNYSIKTPNPICRLFYKIDLLTDFAALCSTDYIDWRYIHSWLVFSTQLVNWCPLGRRNYTCVLLPLYLLSDLPPAPPFPNKMYSIYRQCVAVGGGGLNCAVDHILHEFYTWPDSEPTKFLHHPKQKWPVKTTLRDWCL